MDSSSYLRIQFVNDTCFIFIQMAECRHSDGTICKYSAECNRFIHTK